MNIKELGVILRNLKNLFLKIVVWGWELLEIGWQISGKWSWGGQQLGTGE